MQVKFGLKTNGELPERVFIMASGLHAELFGNSVMRGAPRCNLTLTNSFNITLLAACAAMTGVQPEEVSMRITATLTAEQASSEWYRFAVGVGSSAWVRLWVDDHRLVDQWSGPHGVTPDTPALLPNVTLSSLRPVFVRLDLRPWQSWAAVDLRWSRSIGQLPRTVPDERLAPVISTQQQARRNLQEGLATGWRPWWRHSNTAQIVLPQQVGADFTVRDRHTGKQYVDGALLRTQLPSNGVPAVPVRMGLHAFDSSYSELSFVPFPLGTPNATAAAALNLTVVAIADDRDPSTRICIISTNASTAAAATAANLSLVFRPAAYWGAQATFALEGSSEIAIDTGELGTVHAVLSAPSTVRIEDGLPPALEVLLTEEPLVLRLAFSRATAKPDLGQALKLADRQRSNWLSAMAAAPHGGLSEAFDALATSIAWNVNFDPRVAVTVPVSRAFEEGFDFLFFDWDMYFLSLMAGTRPAAAFPSAFDIALSNLIEVTLTRSAYGFIMNKRAAAGSASSDANDRSEPLVGAMVLQRMWQDSTGQRRQKLQWIAELLFPTLFQWNQWAWTKRRFGVDRPDGGLLVLGSDDNLPCEGSTAGLNSSRQHCASKQSAILESGMGMRRRVRTRDMPGLRVIR